MVYRSKELRDIVVKFAKESISLSLRHIQYHFLIAVTVSLIRRFMIAFDFESESGLCHRSEWKTKMKCNLPSVLKDANLLPTARRLILIRCNCYHWCNSLNTDIKHCFSRQRAERKLTLNLRELFLFLWLQITFHFLGSVKIPDWI